MRKKLEDTETTLRNLFNLLNNDEYLCIIELTEDDGASHKMEKDFLLKKAIIIK